MNYYKQKERYANSLGLTLEDMPVVLPLSSFHEIGREIRQRKDTGEYIFMQYECSFQDGVDDMFGVKVISKAEFDKYVQDEKEKEIRGKKIWEGIKNNEPSSQDTNYENILRNEMNKTPMDRFNEERATIN